MTAFEKIKAFLTGKNIPLTPDEEASLKKDFEPAAPPATPPVNPGNSQQFGGAEIAEIKAFVQAQNQKIDAMNDILKAEHDARVAAEKALSEKAKADTKAKIDEKIKKMKADGKIGAQDEEREKLWRKQFETDFETAEKTEALIPPVPNAPAPDAAKPPNGAGGLFPADKRMEVMSKAKDAFKTNLTN